MPPLEDGFDRAVLADTKGAPVQAGEYGAVDGDDARQIGKGSHNAPSTGIEEPNHERAFELTLDQLQGAARHADDTEENDGQKTGRQEEYAPAPVITSGATCERKAQIAELQLIDLDAMVEVRQQREDEQGDESGEVKTREAIAPKTLRWVVAVSDDQQSVAPKEDHRPPVFKTVAKTDRAMNRMPGDEGASAHQGNRHQQQGEHQEDADTRPVEFEDELDVDQSRRDHDDDGAGNQKVDGSGVEFLVVIAYLAMPHEKTPGAHPRPGAVDAEGDDRQQRVGDVEFEILTGRTAKADRDDGRHGSLNEALGDPSLVR